RSRDRSRCASSAACRYGCCSRSAPRCRVSARDSRQLTMGETATRFALLRFSGELSIKARGTRAHFRRRRIQNLRDALDAEGSSARIEVSHERMFVELPGGDESMSLRDHALTRVFGISSASLAVRHAVWEA